MLFEPAIRLAEEGFPLSPLLHAVLQDEEQLGRNIEARELYFDAAGRALPIGSMIRNPRLAETFRRIAQGGADAFYSGPIAADIVTAVATQPLPGGLSLADLRAYRAVEREPVCGPLSHLDHLRHAAASSGGITVVQILTMLEQFPLDREPPLSARFAHLFAEAGRLAFADRKRYLADSDFVQVPVMALIDHSYLARRSESISTEHSLGIANPGELSSRWPIPPRSRSRSRPLISASWMRRATPSLSRVRSRANSARASRSMAFCSITSSRTSRSSPA